MRIVLFITLLSSAQLSYSYEYEIEKALFQGRSSPAHESITSLAIDCLENFSSPDQHPSSCIRNTQKIESYRSGKSVLIKSVSSSEIPATMLLDAPSWPDDPTRQGSYYGAKAKINLHRKCDNFWSFLGFEEYYESISGGLFCNSHLGVLQFFHSQASYVDEAYKTTRNKTLSWIRFNYEIVKDKSILSKPYCEFFNELKKDEMYFEMAEAFLPSRHEKRLLQCKYNYNLDWIYSNKCTNFISSEQCTRVGSTYDYQIAALGAIIHAIQDSYSLSHTRRRSCSNGDDVPISIASCSPIKEYYAYNAQNEDMHGKSDVLPIAIDSSCLENLDNGETKIDDVVTATSIAIWYAVHFKETDNFISYLERSVFVDPYGSSMNPHPGPRASGGKCYVGSRRK